MKVVNIEEIGRHLESLEAPEPRIVVSGNFATPVFLLRALAASRQTGRLFALNAQSDWLIPGTFTNETPFLGPGMRRDPHLDFLPMRLSLVPRLFASIRPVDVVLLHTSVPRDNKISLGIEVNILPAAIEHARARGGLIIAQMNPHMPYTFGDAEIDLEAVDLGIEIQAVLPSPRSRPPDDVARRIGEGAARFVTDSATIQLGIGQIPDVTAALLKERRALGVWSEMISDGILDLETSGSIDQERPIRASFLFGSPELYDWANGNHRLMMTRTEILNDPSRIASLPGMVAINTAMQIDLFAQANASFIDHAVYSGFGGQPDFVTGALHSEGGHAVVALRSWHDKSDTSAVVPLLSNPVTSFQHSAIVSEHGCAEIFGRSEREQAALIIERVGDPRAQDDLSAAAAVLGLS